MSIPVMHPLDPLAASEIAAISSALRKYIAHSRDSVQAIKFATCTLVPPPKRDVLAFLGIPTEPGKRPKGFSGTLARRASVDYIDAVVGNAYCAYVAQDQPGEAEWIVESVTQLDVHIQPRITVEELLACEAALRADERVIALAAEVGIKPEQLCADGWSIGYDARFPQSLRVQQGLLYARLDKDEHLYAHPLDFCPVLDSTTLKVIHIDFGACRGLSIKPINTRPPPLECDPLEAAGRARIAPPMQRFDYLSDLRPDQPVRKDLKPLHIVQPDGVSFSLDGHVLSWQKWKMHVAFSTREGLVLSAITYDDDGELRPLFYRLSLAEMIVPYGEPIHPHARKFAFDVGEYGIGVTAMELALGCDCLGTIAYMPAQYMGQNGEPIIVPNAICIHEEDGGLLWKHADFRIGGRSASARSRRLVVSMIGTLANYEYAFYYQFLQDGSVNFEVRMTGVLSLSLTSKDAPPESELHGTIVAPQVIAHYHQHLYSLRIDPMIDGLCNTVLESDVVPLEAPTGSAENWAGNGFRLRTRSLKNLKNGDGARDYNATTDRRWRVVNPARKHYASGEPVGYSVHGIRGFAATLLPRDDSIVARRGGFARKTLWVVPEQEAENGESLRMWPAGRYVPQSRGDARDTVELWAAGQDDGDDSIEARDIIMFVTFGSTHIPRPEDFPVMPAEHIVISLKPSSFFAVNPALDVPVTKDVRSIQSFSSSTLGSGVLVSHGADRSSIPHGCSRTNTAEHTTVSLNDRGGKTTGSATVPSGSTDLACLPTMTTAQTDFTSIPVLEYSLIASDRVEFLKQLRHALIHVGFFYLHGAPVDTESVVAQIPRFFSLPQTSKDAISMRNSPHFYGYTGFGTEFTKGARDMREQIDFATPLERCPWKEGDPEYRKVRGPAQWPSEEELPGFRSVVETFLAKTEALALEFISLVSEALGLGNDGLSEFFEPPGVGQHISKLTRYPETVDGASNQGVGPHFDSGILTFLLQASSHRGLQVQNFAGEWIDIPPLANTYVVNIGKGLAALTSGTALAACHRVLAPPPGTGTRYSVPFFQHIAQDVVLGEAAARIKLPANILAERDARGKAVTEAVNYSEYDRIPAGEVFLMARLRSHPDVAAEHYPDLFKQLFPDGLPVQAAAY